MAVRPVAFSEEARTGSSKFRVTVPAVKSTAKERIVGPV